MEVLLQNFSCITWQMLVMWAIGGTLIYLAIVEEMEPTLLLPMSNLLEKLAYIIVPAGKETAKTVELDERLLATPSIALGQCCNLVVKMAEETAAGIRMSLNALLRADVAEAEAIRAAEASVDHYEDVLGTFLTKLAPAQYERGQPCFPRKTG